MSPLLLAALAVSQPTTPPAADWKEAEKQYLSNITQVTKDFARAGEGYFSPDGKKVIYQAEEKDTGNPFYQIFVQDLESGKNWKVSPETEREVANPVIASVNPLPETLVTEISRISGAA